MKYFKSIHAVIIKVFQSSITVCASLRSAPALGKEYLPERRGFGNLGSQRGGYLGTWVPKEEGIWEPRFPKKYHKK